MNTDLEWMITIFERTGVEYSIRLWHNENYAPNGYTCIYFGCDFMMIFDNEGKAINTSFDCPIQ